eukprot:5682318-Pleurochrysis_carterae.AAC.2
MKREACVTAGLVVGLKQSGDREGLSVLSKRVRRVWEAKQREERAREREQRAREREQRVREREQPLMMRKETRERAMQANGQKGMLSGSGEEKEASCGRWQRARERGKQRDAQRARVFRVRASSSARVRERRRVLGPLENCTQWQATHALRAYFLFTSHCCMARCGRARGMPCERMPCECVSACHVSA